MRFVYFGPYNLPNPKSHSIQIVQMSHALARRGVDIELIVKKLHLAPEQVLAQYGLEPHANLTLRTIAEGKSKLNRWNGRTFRAYLKLLTARRAASREPTVFYFRGTAKAFDAIDAVCGMARLSGIPLLYEVHQIQFLDLENEHGGRFGEGEQLRAYIEQRRRREAEIYPRLGGIITLTTRLKELLGRHFDVSCPILIAPSGVNLCEAEAPLPIHGRTHDVCYVGSLYDFNGVDLLVEAMASVPGRRLAVVGDGRDGDMERVLSTARRFGVEDRVEFTGRLRHTEAMDWMRRARVLTAPLLKSDREDRVSWCSPGKLVEYMAAGGTIVASRLDSLCDILHDEKNALLFEPNSAASLAAAIKRALENPVQAQSLADRAFADVQEFTFDARARKVIEFAESILARPKSV